MHPYKQTYLENDDSFPKYLVADFQSSKLNPFSPHKRVSSSLGVSLEIVD